MNFHPLSAQFRRKEQRQDDDRECKCQSHHSQFLVSHFFLSLQLLPLRRISQWLSFKESPTAVVSYPYFDYERLIYASHGLRLTKTFTVLRASNEGFNYPVNSSLIRRVAVPVCGIIQNVQPEIKTGSVSMRWPAPQINAVGFIKKFFVWRRIRVTATAGRWDGLIEIRQAVAAIEP